MPYTIGLDYGTGSLRSIIVDTANGNEIATAIYEFESGVDGVFIDPADHNLARQDPAEYLKGIKITVPAVLAQAKAIAGFSAAQVIGIGVDATGSTPMPLDAKNAPVSSHEKFKNNPNAMAWLWKDHTSIPEAAEITALAAKEHPEYLAKCGGTYSSEWFFSKILHCLHVDPEAFAAAYTWVDCADYIPAVLTGTTNPKDIKRGACAAGHKAMYNNSWGGIPSKEFLTKLDPKMGELHDRLHDKTWGIDTSAGKLTKEWSDVLGLPVGIPVAVGAIDAHMGAVGSGIGTGKLVKIIGTSCCDMAVWPKDKTLADIPGICGIANDSILPGYYGLEAGQSAVGDIFNWFVNNIQPGGAEAGSHQALTEAAEKLKPGQSGLLALDWNNGNRTILVDQKLTGLLIGQTCHTKPAEIYRALMEACGFGALTIINRFQEYGVAIHEIINSGGIAEKNATFMQIYADITGCEMKVSRSAQGCALGSAIAGAVVAGKKNGGYDNFDDAQAAMAGVKALVYKPIPENHKTYQRIYKLYKELHDAFGIRDHSSNLGMVMKELLNIKEEANA
eukprot:Platyproteum_vivax@DN3684_c0_g1_i1.p1